MILIAKYLTTAAIIVIVSELAKHSDRLAAMIAALPLVTVMTLIWMHLEKQPAAKLANHSRYTFWYVLPTLPMFWVFPKLLGLIGFWPALGISALVSILAFGLLALLLRYNGVALC